MANVGTELTVYGNFGKNFGLKRVGKNNTPVINFSIAVTPRVRDGNEWKDGETTWVTVSAWNKLAENIDASFNPGDRVFASGRLDVSKDDAGTTFWKLVADHAGLDLIFDAAHSERQSKGGNSGSGASSHKSAPKRQSAPANIPDAGGDDVDDLPF